MCTFNGPQSPPGLRLQKVLTRWLSRVLPDSMWFTQVSICHFLLYRTENFQLFRLRCSMSLFPLSLELSGSIYRFSDIRKKKKRRSSIIRRTSQSVLHGETRALFTSMITVALAQRADEPVSHFVHSILLTSEEYSSSITFYYSLSSSVYSSHCRAVGFSLVFLLSQSSRG